MAKKLTAQNCFDFFLFWNKLQTLTFFSLDDLRFWGHINLINDGQKAWSDSLEIKRVLHINFNDCFV
jgi:hypothetical protein